MKTLYLIRHTEDAAQIVEKLPRPAKLYTSELPAPMQTAQAICDRWHVRPEPLACMNQYDYANEPAAPTLAPPMMLGMPALAIQQPESSPKFTFDDMNAGVEAFLKLAPKFPHRTICVVHEEWLHLLLWHVLGFHNIYQTDNEMAAFQAWQAHTPSPYAWYLHIGDSWETWLQVLDLESVK